MFGCLTDDQERDSNGLRLNSFYRSPEENFKIKHIEVKPTVKTND